MDGTELREKIAEKAWLLMRSGCHWSFHEISWANLKDGKGANKLHEADCYKFADHILELVQSLSAPVDMPVLTEEQICGLMDKAYYGCLAIDQKSYFAQYIAKAQRDADRSRVDAYIKAHLPELAKQAGWVKLPEHRTSNPYSNEDGAKAAAWDLAQSTLINDMQVE